LIKERDLFKRGSKILLI